jgi:hypothetical protein
MSLKAVCKHACFLCSSHPLDEVKAIDDNYDLYCAEECNHQNGGIRQDYRANTETYKRYDCAKVICGLVVPKQQTANDQISHPKN